MIYENNIKVNELSECTYLKLDMKVNTTHGFIRSYISYGKINT